MSSDTKLRTNTGQAWTGGEDVQEADEVADALADARMRAGSPTVVMEGKPDVEEHEVSQLDQADIASRFAGVEQTDVFRAISKDKMQPVLNAAHDRLQHTSTATLVRRMRRYLHLDGPIKPNQLDSWQTFLRYMRWEVTELKWLPPILVVSFALCLLQRLLSDSFYFELERIGWNTVDNHSDGDHTGHGRQAMSIWVTFKVQVFNGIFITLLSAGNLYAAVYMFMGNKHMNKKWTQLYMLYPAFLFLYITGVSTVLVQVFDVHIDLDLFSIPVFLAALPTYWLVAKAYSETLKIKITNRVFWLDFFVLLTFLVYGYTMPGAYFRSTFQTQFFLRVFGHPLLTQISLTGCRVCTLMLTEVPDTSGKMFPTFRVMFWTSIWGRYLVANAPTLEISIALNVGLVLGEIFMRVITPKIDYQVLKMLKGELTAARIMSSPAAVRLYVDLLAIDTFDELYGITGSAIILWLFQWGNPVPGEGTDVGLLLQATGFALALELMSIVAVPYLTGVLLGGGVCGERARVRRKAVKELEADLHKAQTGTMLRVKASDMRPTVVSPVGSPLVMTPSGRGSAKILPAMRSASATGFTSQGSALDGASSDMTAVMVETKVANTASYVGVHRVTGQPVTLTRMPEDIEETELRTVVIDFLGRVRPMDFWEGSKRTFTNVVNSSYSRPKYYILVMLFIALCSFDFFVRAFFNPANITCAHRLTDQTLWYATFKHHFCPPQEFFGK